MTDSTEQPKVEGSETMPVEGMEPGVDENVEPPKPSLARVTEDTDEAEGALLRSTILKLLASLHALHAKSHASLVETRRLRALSEKSAGTGGSKAEDIGSGTSIDSDKTSRFLQDQRAVGIGSASGISLINALNQAPTTYVADLYQTAPQTLNQTLRCLLHLQEAISGSLALRDPLTQRLHALTSFEQTAFILGLQQFDQTTPGLAFHGQPAISSIVDIAMHSQENAEVLRRLKTGVVVAARDIRTKEEAAWFSEVAESIEKKTGLGPDNLRVILVVDTVEGMENHEAICWELAARLSGIRFDAAGVVLSTTADGKEKAVDVAKGTGELGAYISSLAATAHKYGVTCVWEGPAPTEALHLFKTGPVDGFTYATRAQADEVLESAEDAFEGTNQISGKSSGKAPAKGKGTIVPSDLGALMVDIAESYASAENRLSRGPDLVVSELLKAHAAGKVDEKSIRDALMTLRKQYDDSQISSDISGAIRSLLRKQDGLTRLSDAIYAQRREA